MTKRYKNVGTSPVDVGHKEEYLPGVEFEAKLDEAQEQWLVKDLGALRVVDGKSSKDDDKK